MQLIMWVVYKCPSDFPGEFVARKFLIGNDPDPVPTKDIMTASDLSILRAILSENHTRLPRDEGDDPVIVESWI